MPNDGCRSCCASRIDLGLAVSAPSGPFVPVQVNDDLTFDFDDRGRVEPGHYAFLIDDDTFDAVLGRLAKWPAVEYGSGPERGWDRQINHLAGGRGVYVRDPRWSQLRAVHRRSMSRAVETNFCGWHRGDDGRFGVVGAIVGRCQVLTDQQWELLEPLLPRSERRVGRKCR
ncbi:hypothetical protein ABZ894_00480 [Nocardia beijingensis]|uniref:hypothetical protein n=1 Tax=Nocardia beijingensis TaxID=95162 RepID=UPI0033C5409C